MTKEQLTEKVLGNTGRDWTAKILLLLLSRQTADEQNAKTTSESNSMGFSGTDGHIGTGMALNIQRRGYITEGEYNYWIKESRGGPRICKYWRQVNEAIEEKSRQAAA